MTAKKRAPSEAAGSRETLLGSLRQFIRTKGADYLRDPNVSSIGVGYKVVNGKPTEEISLQFTVNEKVAEPEGLESLGTNAIPESIVVDGVEVPTDVIEASYEPSFRVVPEAESPVRKTRIDPIVPGVSVANVNVSAGTVGCIVFDKKDGTPYILSNWHVLHGPAGKIGDVVVQPGPRDDNRIAKNRLGTLVRSHLGIAGDCAVATIEDRRFGAEISDLGVAPEQLGEPQLGDKVIKSGRTTAVTHGIVRRVDVTAKIDYGQPVGEQNIGCFEIGVDPNNPALNEEISQGGDSGSVWLFKAANGKPTKVLAGLHFGGEGAFDPDERALACLPASVFEKLEITLQPTVVVESVEAATGYDPNFLGPRIEVPELNAAVRDDAVRLDGSAVINYTHFSLAHSTSRRFAYWVGWNIDGAAMKKARRKGVEFVKDPRIQADVQVGNELYQRNRLDRGHLARRADLLWGSQAEAEKANIDSFFYTNITPQMDDFNQSGRDGVWGELEDAVFADVDIDDLKVSVFGGPVFQADDRVHRGVALPREYWKVIVFVEQSRLKCKAFLLTQNLDQIEALDLDEFRVFQVTLTEIEQRGQFRFPAALRDADTLAVPESVEQRKPLESSADIQW